MPDVRALTHGRIETRIAKKWRGSSGRTVLVLALTLPLFCLCLLPAGAHAQTSEIPLSELPPAPTSGTLPNGVGFEVNVGAAHSTQGYVFYPPESPQVWTFDQPVSFRFGLRGLNIAGECYVLPVEAVVESIHPSHSWDPDNRRLCRGSGSQSGDSIFTIAEPVTELVLDANSGPVGAGRGPGFFQVTLQTDLAIEKLAQVLDANQVRFTLTVSNSGPVDATDVTVVDELPACTTHVSNDCGATVAGSEVTWTIGDLANGSTAACEILVDATACIGEGTQTNTATVEAAQDETNPDNNTAAAEFELAASPSITLDKTGSGPDPLTVGATIDYSFLVTNTGNVTLSNVTVTDPLPGLSPIDCPDDTLAPGAEMTCTASYTVTQEDADTGIVQNTATASGDPPSGPAVSDDDFAVVPPSQKPGISLEKTGSGPNPLTVGATVDYSFAVTNTGNVTLSNVTVTDPLPGLSPISCPDDTLAPGAEMTCTATYTVTQDDADAGVVQNTATATGQPPGDLPSPTDESSATVPPSQAPGISIEKSGSGPDPLTVGSSIEYTFLVTNTGNVTLTDVTVTDPLPGLSPISCPGTTLAPGAEMTCTATYTVTQADAEAGVVENTATVTGQTPTGGEPPTDTSTTTVPPAEPVPALPPFAVLLLVAALSALAALFLRRVRA